MIGGRDGARNFQMSAFYQNAVDGDIAFQLIPLAGGPTQPPGHSILYLPIQSWAPALFDPKAPPLAQTWSSLISSSHTDLSRVDAIFIDEPYANYLGNGNTGGDPCRPTDSRASAIRTAYSLLQTAAGLVKQSSPRTRFWVNFSQSEANWLRQGSCNFVALPDGTTGSLDAPYIDVVSVDWYNVDFNATVLPVYQWFSGHRSYPGQQMALVPGTFLVSNAFIDPVGQAEYLEEYFDYATSMNQSCTLPFGSNGPTGNFDRCPVWIVIGWVYNNFPGGTNPNWNFIGLGDPQAGAIQAAWQAELSTGRVVPSWWPVIQQFLN
jgi:hypothetical protein